MPKVVYFDLQGRAQAIRYLLTHKGVEFEDVRLTQEDWAAAKAAGTYTAVGGSLPDRVRCFVDSDHAGCAVTGKSTTGLVCKIGNNVIKHSDNLQSTISLSSGESEYYAIVKASQVGIGLQSLLADWGLTVGVEVLSDSSAARGHVQRRGLGKMRHIEIRDMWLQKEVCEGKVKVFKVLGEENPADLMTKHLVREKIDSCMANISQEVRRGRAHAGLDVQGASTKKRHDE